jgi:hypothetical protein
LEIIMFTNKTIRKKRYAGVGGTGWVKESESGTQTLVCCSRFGHTKDEHPQDSSRFGRKERPRPLAEALDNPQAEDEQ